MMFDQQRLDFFCLVHEEICTTTRDKKDVNCEQGHVISEDYKRDKWEYCCGCESFFSRDDHEAARTKCPRCGRQLSSRYLCSFCSTLCSDNVTPSQHGMSFVLGAPQFCPFCLTKPPSHLSEHYCRQLKASFHTALSECPLCAEYILPQERFEFIEDNYLKRPLHDYLSGIKDKAITAVLTGVNPPKLMESADGHFMLMKHGLNGFFIVFPCVERLKNAQEFMILQPIFDGESPAVGEVWIAAPGVAYHNKLSNCWILTQKGRLQIRVSDPAANVRPEPVLRSADTISPPSVSKESQEIHELDKSPLLNSTTLDSPFSTERDPVSSTDGTHKKVIFSGGALLLITVIVLTYFYITSPKRQILSKIKQGHIVTPAGNSAYELFLHSNLSDSDYADLRSNIVPVLESTGNEVIRQLVGEGISPSIADCDNTAKIYTWLNTLEPRKSFRARELYFQGRSAFDRKDYSGAENYFRQALNLEPSWALLVNHIGRLYVQRRDYISADSWYHRASELDPSWVIPRINRCVMVVENIKNYRLGERVCRTVIQLDGNKASGYYFLGRALEAQNRRCEALTEYRTAIIKSSGIVSPGFNVERLSRRVPNLAYQCGE